jgi:hypothetical protein
MTIEYQNGLPPLTEVVILEVLRIKRLGQVPLEGKEAMDRALLTYMNDCDLLNFSREDGSVVAPGGGADRVSLSVQGEALYSSLIYAGKAMLEDRDRFGDE